MENPEVLFEKWYVTPLKVLQSIPGGDGAFVALATSCFLYERYAIVAIKKSSNSAKVDRDAKIRRFMIDFEVDEDTANAFWDVIRDGLLHGGMPKQREHGKQALPYWAFRHEFPKPVELIEHGEELILKVQPWLVMDKVLSLWQGNLDLLNQNESFPWANVVPLPI
jgi:hypothetical protein